MLPSHFFLSLSNPPTPWQGKGSGTPQGVGAKATHTKYTKRNNVRVGDDVRINTSEEQGESVTVGERGYKEGEEGPVRVEDSVRGRCQILEAVRVRPYPDRYRSQTQL